MTLKKSGVRTHDVEMPLALQTFTTVGESGVSLERARSALISTVPGRMATADAGRPLCLPT